MGTFIQPTIDKIAMLMGLSVENRIDASNQNDQKSKLKLLKQMFPVHDETLVK